MKKLATAAMVVVAAVFLTPGLAHAGTVRGTVAAKQANRHVLVIALKHGKILSARVTPRQLRHTRVGTRLSLAGKRLADGSIRATQLKRLGSAKRARLSVVVMGAKSRRLLVAGGGTTFSIRLRQGTRVLSARQSSVHPGEKVEAEVDLSDNGPVEKDIQSAGEAPLIEFSGVVSAMDATSLTVTSDGIDTVVELPNGITLPPIVHTGSHVEIVASIAGSTLTLTMIKLDGESGDSGGCNVDDSNRVEAEGSVSGLDAHSITVQPGDNATPVTFAIPDGFTLPPGLAMGSVVEARGEVQHDLLTLTRIELATEDGDQTEIGARGTVTALDSGSITIHTDGGLVTFTIPDGFTLPDGLALGSFVAARGEKANDAITLTEIELLVGGDNNSG